MLKHVTYASVEVVLASSPESKGYTKLAINGSSSMSLAGWDALDTFATCSYKPNTTLLFLSVKVRTLHQAQWHMSHGTPQKPGRTALRSSPRLLRPFGCGREHDALKKRVIFESNRKLHTGEWELALGGQRSLRVGPVR